MAVSPEQKKQLNDNLNKAITDKDKPKIKALLLQGAYLQENIQYNDEAIKTIAEIECEILTEDMKDIPKKKRRIDK